MKKTFKKEVCGLVLLGILPLVALPIAHWVDKRRIWVDKHRIEIVAQKDIKEYCGPQEMDHWETLIKSLNQNRHTYRFTIEGDYDAPNDYINEELFYDRQFKTLRYVHRSVEKGANTYTHEIIYGGVSDALLQAFVTTTRPDDYSSKFTSFCKTNGCVVKSDTNRYSK